MHVSPIEEGVAKEVNPDELQLLKMEAYLTGMRTGILYAQDVVEDHERDPDSVVIVTEADMRESFEFEEPERAHLFDDYIQEILIDKYIEGWRVGSAEMRVE